jgi:hypothetical protein
MYFCETKKQAKIDLINQAFEEEVADIKKELKRIKLIKQELWDEIEAFQRSLLERIDELEQYGNITALESKKYSNKIYKVKKVVPGNEIDAAVSRLEAQILRKQLERDKKMKKIKIKKKIDKKLVEKLTPT